MKGSEFVSVGPITIGCISAEARDLLDIIMERWDQHIEKVRKHSPDYEPTPYAMAYWLVRWSGLIQPASGLTTAAPDAAVEYCKCGNVAIKDGLCLDCFALK